MYDFDIKAQCVSATGKIKFEKKKTRKKERKKKSFKIISICAYSDFAVKIIKIGFYFIFKAREFVTMAFFISWISDFHLRAYLHYRPMNSLSQLTHRS